MGKKEVNLNSEHELNCACEKCDLISKGFSEEHVDELLAEKYNALIEKYGHVVRTVTERLDDNSVISIDAYTEGLEKTYSHTELQIVMPMRPTDAQEILNNAARLIAQGRVFKHSDVVYNGIIQDGYPIKFVDNIEYDKQVLRMLICDTNKKLPDEEGCNPLYALQLEADTSQ